MSDDSVKKIGSASDKAEMSFFDHIDELRKHILRSMAAILVVSVVVFILKDLIFGTIIFGPKNEGFLTFRFFCWMSEAIGMGDQLCMKPVDFEVISVELGERFITHLKVAFGMGFIFAFPIVFREFWSFIKPGLHKNELAATRGVVFVCSILFIFGALFGYFVISPFAINWLAGYEVTGVNQTVSLSSYVNYMIMFVIPTGLVFELPIVVFFLSKIGIVTPEFMRQYRKHSIVVILVGASVITPPDIITQFLIAIPIYFLYELSIHISAREAKKIQNAAKA